MHTWDCRPGEVSMPSNLGRETSTVKGKQNFPANGACGEHLDQLGRNTTSRGLFSHHTLLKSLG